MAIDCVCAAVREMIHSHEFRLEVSEGIAKKYEILFLASAFSNLSTVLRSILSTYLLPISLSPYLSLSLSLCFFLSLYLCPSISLSLSFSLSLAFPNASFTV